MTLTFSTLPLSTNRLYRPVGNRLILTQEARDYKNTIAWEARAQYRGKPLKGDLAIEVLIFWPDKRRHDTDNDKAFYDALNGIVWEDDHQISDKHSIRILASDNPHVELRVWPLDT